MFKTKGERAANGVAAVIHAIDEGVLIERSHLRIKAAVVRPGVQVLGAGVDAQVFAF